MSVSNAAVADSARPALALGNIAALGVAAAGSAGSVYLSVGLGLKACPLCFYQRTFVMAAALAVAMLLWLDGLRTHRACVVALPLSVSGLGVALFHVYLVQVGKLECPPALAGWGDGPLQSLGIFAALTFVSALGTWTGRRMHKSGGLSAIVLSVLLGAAVSWACIASAPPLPPAPAKPYDPVAQPFDMCRPPYRGE